MSSYQYRKSHCGDKTVVRSSYFHHGISYTGKMSSLYWIRALVFNCFQSYWNRYLILSLSWHEPKINNFTIRIKGMKTSKKSLKYEYIDITSAVYSRYFSNDYILNSRLFIQLFIQTQFKDTSKLRVTGLYVGNSPVTNEFPAQRASNEENVSIW